MATEKHPGQSSDAHQDEETFQLPKYRPNISGLLALAASILAVTIAFHGSVSD